NARCVSTHQERESNDPLALNDCCDFCGLPLSAARVGWALKYANKNKGFTIVRNLLRKSEIEALIKWRKAQLEKEFRSEYGIEPPNDTFTGDVTQRNRFSFTIDKKLANKIKEKAGGKGNYSFFDKHETGHLDFWSHNSSFDLLKEANMSDLDSL